MIARLVQPIRRWPLGADVLLACLMFGLALALNDVGFETGALYPWVSLPPYSVAVSLLALTMLPVAVRRRLPFTALLVGTTGLVVARLLYVPEYQLSSIALFLVIYSAGRWGDEHRRDRWRFVAVSMVLGALIAGVIEERRFLSAGMITERAYVLATTVGIMFNLVFIVSAWVLGNVTRARADREQDLATAHQQLLATRAEAEQRAVSDERLRIARELHDVVAHHVSVMGVQAGAARRVLEASPDTAANALGDIEESSRQAVAELHRLLGFLRTADVGGSADGLVDTPAPGLLELSFLQKQTAAAGLAVSLSIEGERPSSVPASIDLSAYRIVQEALTNSLKHSGQQEADVAVRYGERSVQVCVRDRGTGVTTSTRQGGGNGLVGMQERVALHGGHLSFGPVSAGGFEVTAELPFDRVRQHLELQQ